MKFVERFAIFLVFAFTVQALSEDGVHERSGPLVIGSYNYPDRHIKIDDDGAAWIRKEEGYRFFIVSPGLSGAPGSISFESEDAPGSYLRHQDYLMFLHQYSEEDLYNETATFLPIEDKFYQGYTVYESANLPTYYIRHQNYRLKISQEDNSEILHEDASFVTTIVCEAPMEFNSCGSACPNTCEEQDGSCTRNCVPGCFCPSDTVLHEGNCIALEDCPEVCEAPMEFNSCGSACPNTCEEQDGSCTRNCVPGCFCPSDTVLHEGNCIALEDCPEECEAPMEFNSCGSACPDTCEEQDGSCTRNCVPGCFCPSDTVLHEGNCIALEDCPEVPTPDEGWYAPGNGYQYMATDQKKKVNKCKNTCSGLGGYLATSGMDDSNVLEDIVLSVEVSKAWTGLLGDNGNCIQVKQKKSTVNLKEEDCKKKASCLCEKLLA